MRDALDRIGTGDPGGSIDTTSADEVAILPQANKMNQNLFGIVSQVRTSADAVLAAAQQLAQANSELASRTEQQASTLEQTSAGMEEFAATIAQNADHCHSASARGRNQ